MKYLAIAMAYDDGQGTAEQLEGADVVLCGECASGFLMPQRRAMRGVVTGECDGCGVYRSRVRRAVLRLAVAAGHP